MSFYTKLARKGSVSLKCRYVLCFFFFTYYYYYYIFFDKHCMLYLTVFS